MGSNSKNTRYDEYLAKLELEEFFPEMFINLVIRDKPDLRCGDKIGIEVTTAIDHKNFEMDSLYSKLGTDEVKDESKICRRIEKNGGIINGGILFHPGMNENFENIKKAFQDKLNKLNSGKYQLFEKQYVFISDWILASSKMLKNGLNDVVNIQRECKNKFNGVFIRVPNYLYFLDLDQRTFKIIDYDSSIQYKLADEAAKHTKKKE